MAVQPHFEKTRNGERPAVATTSGIPGQVHDPRLACRGKGAAASAHFQFSGQPLPSVAIAANQFDDAVQRSKVTLVSVWLLQALVVTPWLVLLR
jgi:hypothetical protein